MIPLYGKPLLEYIVSGLISAGLKNIIMVIGYRKEQIINYFQNGNKWGIKIEYVIQKELNGTGGALRLCENLITDSHLFLTWGDILVSHQIYKKIIKIYNIENQDFILVVNYTDDPFKGGAVYCENDYCVDIIEKPKQGKSKSNLNNSGIFILNREIFGVLRDIKPSARGEIELPDALKYGMTKKDWRIRILKMEREQFRGDFGDKAVYEQLSKDSSWLKKLN
jgi:bifunctional UDP-N-acetylglucosamine pyrophosphorylase/glucosamine-1-phosphate N-acetyltransferase